MTGPRNLPRVAVLLFGVWACADADTSGPALRGGDAGATDSAAPPDARGEGATIDAVANCTLIPQDGCPDGFACDLAADKLATAGTHCRAVSTPGGETDSCLGPTDCAAGFGCLGSPGQLTCGEYCSDDTVCTPPGGICFGSIYYDDAGVTRTVPGVDVCSHNCDPLGGEGTSVGCPAGWGCHLYYEDSRARYYTACYPAGAGGQAAACASDTDCQIGFSCIPTTTKACRKTCAFGTGVDCADVGASCMGYDPAEALGGVEYGSCL